MLELSIILLLIFCNSVLLCKIIKFVKEIKKYRKNQNVRILDKFLISLIIIINILYIILLMLPLMLSTYSVQIFIFSINYLLIDIFILEFYRMSIQKYNMLS